MKRFYIWEQSGWPYLTWDNRELAFLLGEVRNKQGRLTGIVGLLGDELKKSALYRSVISEITASTRIEGKSLDEGLLTKTTGQYPSKNKFKLSETDNPTVGASQVFMDTFFNYENQISTERLFLWKHALEGKTGYDRSGWGWFETDALLGLHSQKPIERKMENMTVPIPANTAGEMKSFLTWVNTLHPTDPVIKAGVAYLRFLLIRPFEDDNGLIARCIANIFLSRADRLEERFYSISAQIENNRSQYQDVLLHTQTGNTDITEWLRWFLYNLDDAISNVETTVMRMMNKSRFFDKYRLMSLNERQLKMLNIAWDGDGDKLTSSHWASMNNCSPDTALRDIQDLISKKILRKEQGGGRSTSYCLNIEKKIIF